MYKLFYTTAFKKSLKKIKKRNKDFDLTKDVLFILQKSGVEGIPEYMVPHKLKGDYKDNWNITLNLISLLFGFK